MKTLFFVKPEEGDLARHMEAKLLKLPLSSGVLFVGVSVDPGERPIYRVWVGCSRNLDEALMDSLVRVTLREEIDSGAIIAVEAHRGLSRNSLESV